MSGRSPHRERKSAKWWTVAGEQLLVQHLQAALGEAVRVVDLRDRPRLARLRISGGVRGGLVGGHRRRVHLQMVRVGIPAVLVVGDHHVRTELPDPADQGAGDLVVVGESETSLRKRRCGVPLRQARIHIPPPMVVDTQDVGGTRHLAAPHRGQVGGDVRPVHRRVEDVAAFTPGAGLHQHADTLRDIPGHGRRPLGRLVVGMSVDRHQAETGHRGTCRSSTGTLDVTAPF